MANHSLPSNGAANLGVETEIWRAADALRSNMDAAEYKHVVLGLIFLKYISDVFEEKHRDLHPDLRADFVLANPPFNDSDWRGDMLPSPSGRGAAGEGYADVAGFCKAATLEEIRQHGHILTPGRYVGAAEVAEDGEPFEEKMAKLVARLREQQGEASRLDDAIVANLQKLGFGD